MQEEQEEEHKEAPRYKHVIDAAARQGNLTRAEFWFDRAVVAGVSAAQRSRGGSGHVSHNLNSLKGGDIRQSRGLV